MPDDTVVYVVSIVNSAATPVSRLTDHPDAYELLQHGKDAFDLPRRLHSALCQWSRAGGARMDVPAKYNVVLMYSAEVNQFVLRGRAGAIVNTAAPGGASLSAFISDTELLAAVAESELSVIKSLSPIFTAKNNRRPTPSLSRIQPPRWTIPQSSIPLCRL